MDGPAGWSSSLASCSAGLSLASPRWPSVARPGGTALASPRLHGPAASQPVGSSSSSCSQHQRPARGCSIVAAAQFRFSAAPLPASFTFARQQSVSAGDQTDHDGEQPAQWSDSSGKASGAALQDAFLHVSHLAETAVAVATQPVYTVCEHAVGGARGAQSALATVLRNALAWVLSLVARMHSMLLGLVTGSRGLFNRSGNTFSLSKVSTVSAHGGTASHRMSSASPAIAIAPVRTSQVAHTSSTVSGSGSAQPSSSSSSSSSNRAGVTIGGSPRAAAPGVVRLQAGQKQAAAAGGGQVRTPSAAVVAVTAAAALGCVGWWLVRQWRETEERRLEVEQYSAVQQVSLARQKQRFQRALVVDSVNLELPAIKEMDFQPGPVQVEKIISRAAQSPQQQKAAAAAAVKEQKEAAAAAARNNDKQLGLSGGSLRQWQQFMSASRTTEVKNVTRSSQGSRVAALTTDGPCHQALGDRALADISEKIRRANDPGVPGAGAASPVITFEQLYANDKESDEEAMARRAAGRKARWQKQQQQPQSGSGSSSSASSSVDYAPSRSSSTQASASSSASLAGNHASSAPQQQPVRRAGSSSPKPPPPPPLAAASGSLSAPQDELTSTLSARSLNGAMSRTAPTAGQTPGAPISAGNPFAVGLFGSAAAGNSPSLSGVSPSTSGRGAAAAVSSPAAAAIPTPARPELRMPRPHVEEAASRSAESGAAPPSASLRLRAPEGTAAWGASPEHSPLPSSSSPRGEAAPRSLTQPRESLPTSSICGSGGTGVVTAGLQPRRSTLGAALPADSGAAWAGGGSGPELLQGSNNAGATTSTTSSGSSSSPLSSALTADLQHIAVPIAGSGGGGSGGGGASQRLRNGATKPAPSSAPVLAANTSSHHAVARGPSGRTAVGSSGDDDDVAVVAGAAAVAAAVAAVVAGAESAPGGGERPRRVGVEGGQLRRPDTQPPGLVRLMRRPTGPSPAGPASKQDATAATAAAKA